MERARNSGPAKRLAGCVRVRRCESGQAATEVAMLLPILCLLLIGIVQFGTLIAMHMDLISATRDAARRAVAARELESPEDEVTAAFEASADLVDSNDVTLDIDGEWVEGGDVTVTATMPHELDVVGLVVWSGDIRAESRVRIG